MLNSQWNTVYERLVGAARSRFPQLRFEILEIGALPLGESPEPFHRLLDDFPGSRLHAFELDPQSCEELRRRARSGMQVHQLGIGRRRERRTVHLTRHSMCTSLYPPNQPLLECFHNMEFASLRDAVEIETTSIDEFATEIGLDRVDFVKIDIQGAELDAFQGGVRSLRSCVAIVTEVEFVELYEQQPLFADVDRELRRQGFMLHKFMGMAGRALRPLVLANDPCHASWHLWSDAMFVRSLWDWPEMAPEALVRLGLLAYLYGSPDITYQCLMICDHRTGSDLLRTMHVP